jgi:WXG100 family type VII secretion target
MSMPGHITYVHGEVDTLAANVGNYASVIHSHHEDMRNQTDAIAEFFAGDAATGFREAQLLMLSGLQDLIEVMSNHGQAIGNANMSAMNTDHMIKSTCF